MDLDIERVKVIEGAVEKAIAHGIREATKSDHTAFEYNIGTVDGYEFVLSVVHGDKWDTFTTVQVDCEDGGITAIIESED